MVVHLRESAVGRVVFCDMAPALVIVDVQNGFLNEHTDHIPRRVVELQEGYGLVVATRYYNPHGSNHRRLMGWERFSPGSSEIDLAFDPVEGATVLDKSTYTSVCPRLLELLDLADVEEVHICGVDTDICVSATAVGLFDIGRTPVVLKDFCASHAGEEFHEWGLRILARYIGEKQIR